MPFYEGIRIDPGDSEGIRLVQNIGGESVYLKYADIPKLIKELGEVEKNVKLHGSV